MAEVILKEVSKRYKKSDQLSVKKISLEIKDKEFMVFVGPSGCGKSTTLRMIAGLEQVTEGGIYIGDKLVNDVPPKNRDIAMVFQNYALYPNMDVYENMAFGMWIRKVEKYVIESTVKSAARTLEIEHLLERKPSALSGGQRQRVALGRAIVRKPQVFLMDEPLSNLDAKLRVQMREEIIGLHRRLETTFIYVTHDQIEAMTMGTRICVMKDGIIQQVDTPENIYNSPANQFVASFIGSPPMNFLPGKIIEKKSGCFFDTKRFALPISQDLNEPLAAGNFIDRAIVMGIRPEHIVQKRDMETGSAVKAKVRFTELVGADRFVHLETGDYRFTMRATSHERFGDDSELEIVFKPEHMNFFHPETGVAVR
ncbi:ABC transporter ATP-binding protein [Paenibacillus nasutitermitis]|uniref:ABC transporter ATP-binding protein n=1 Tax=Paenibacillus nasutitermitis TaxID=1652958 RepID=A0A916ZF67_9BACL|nr:sn-glycerol-3-phosphate ABC transporter ATP-binding protein UgpC [Paenibacillus nasutitermitis]GGD93515.1 ABC transporter ATP-binding protein [Paenibacillus nasutitermitis]